MDGSGIANNIGTLAILNVGEGDTKLTFDPNNAAEKIRAARIVRDMLRRGYALLIEVDDGQGGKTTTRVLDFDETRHEYIIADFDSTIGATNVRATEPKEPPKSVSDTTLPPPPAASGLLAEPQRRGRKRVVASAARGVAVARTAGG